MKSAVLLTKSMSVRHTADNFVEKLNQAVESWGLTGRVIACVHDNARNIVSANNPTRVSWHSVPCFAHTLQLAVNNGFAAYLNRVIAAAGRLVKHFNHSTPATKALEVKQQQMQLPISRGIMLMLLARSGAMVSLATDEMERNFFPVKIAYTPSYSILLCYKNACFSNVTINL